MIETKELSKTVSTEDGNLTILSSISLSINKAESVAIVGTSGSGKSTLIGLLAGLDTPTKGQIFINQQNITDMNEDKRAELRNQLIGFVFQSFQLLPNLTALENVMLPLELRADQLAREKASQLLDKVGLSQRLNHIPAKLSGGEQQRVALARAFVTDPVILFADEPTGNLDSHTGQQIIELLFQLNQEKQTTLVLVSHDQKLANRCDKILQIEAGKLL